MEKLLALIAEASDEEDVILRFAGATWSGTSLELQLAVSVLEADPGIWEVRCEHVLASLLCNESARWLELLDDHPLLWEFKHESAQAFFYGAPDSTDAAVGALYDAHQNAVGSWIRFGQYLNTSLGISKLLSAGNGLLAEGPVQLLTSYKDALRPHGVEVDIRFAHPPRSWDGTHWRHLDRKNTKALILGTCYVIGKGFAAEQKS
jgi:hypothetical protein